MSTAVAISTTGDPHRLPLLVRAVEGWLKSGVNKTFVTVDGGEESMARVVETLLPFAMTPSIYRVGQPIYHYVVGQPTPPAMLGHHVHKIREGRLGVAVNKNTGLELMMNNTRAEHLFLSDDDIWPLTPAALGLHVSGNATAHQKHSIYQKHSMVCWGQHRFEQIMQDHQCAAWSWPRGSMLYAHRSVVETVGGMIEAFGPGGHEHVEWSRRIHAHGFTPAPFVSPYVYATERALAAKNYWHAEDMPLPGEHIAGYAIRKESLTSVRRKPEDWKMIEEIMRRTEGSTAYVPYRADDNNRASATLYHSSRA